MVRRQGRHGGGVVLGNQFAAGRGASAPALKAIFPTEPGNDLLRDIVGTGGGLGVGFMPLWLSLVNGLKFVPDIQALAQGRFDQRWLQDRLRDPLTLFPALIEAMTAPDINGLDPGTLRVAQDGQFYEERKAQTANIEVPTMLYGAWHDIFANSEPRVYNDIPLPAGEKQLIMSDATTSRSVAASANRVRRHDSTSSNAPGSTSG